MPTFGLASLDSLFKVVLLVQQLTGPNVGCEGLSCFIKKYVLLRGSLWAGGPRARRADALFGREVREPDV